MSITVIYKFARLGAILTVLLPEPQNILHIKQAGLLSRQPFGGSHSASSKGQAARGFMGNLYALTLPGKQYSVVANNIPSAHRGKANGLRIAGLLGRSRAL